jgi:glycerophosphoryl diester phosphodiesterase
VIQEYGLQERCIVQSFNYEALEAVKAIDDSIPCGYILTTAAGQYYDLEAADFFSMNISFLTERAVASAHLRNKKIMVWTVNTEEYLKEAVRMKVDGIITDDPVLAREVVYGSQLSLEEFLEEELVLEEMFQDTILE